MTTRDDKEKQPLRFHLERKWGDVIVLCMEDNQGLSWNILGFNSDGTVSLYRSISANIGLKVGPRGQVVQS